MVARTNEENDKIHFLDHMKILPKNVASDKIK